MNCARCGAANEPGMNFCINCGNPLSQQPPPPPVSFDQPTPPSWQPPSPYGQQQPPPFGQAPSGFGQQPHRPPLNQPQLFAGYTGDIPNYLTQAILCTIFCCVPAGIVAIIYASQVNSKKQMGDLGGAAESSSKAQTWCWVAFGLGLIGIALNVMIVIADL